MEMIESQTIFSSLTALLLGLSVSLCSWAQPPDSDFGDALQFFPGPLLPLGLVAGSTPKAGAPNNAAGWRLTEGDLHGGGDWWALVCERGCSLYATQLKVSNPRQDTRHGARPDSQLLYWSPLPHGLNKLPPRQSLDASTPSKAAGDAPPEASPPAPTLIGLFKPVRANTALRFKAGAVKTWLHAGMDAYPPNGRIGGMEIRIPLDGEPEALLVPRVFPRKAGPEQEKRKRPEDIATLELRAYGKRQALAGYHLESYGDGFDSTEILRWAGDLDGDGQLDLIISHDKHDVDVAVYLSSMAQPGELVGLAGRLQQRHADTAGN